MAGSRSPADQPGVKLFVDENLSPRLVSVARERGYDAACARDRGLLGERDSAILGFCLNEDRVCVTNNAGDFRELVGNIDVHPGLIVLPNTVREAQLEFFGQALEFIEQEAKKAGQAPRDLLVNHALEVDETGTCTMYELPAPV